MSNVVVYVFLLDQLMGFYNSLNETVINNTPNNYSSYTPVLRQCDIGISDQILRAIGKQLEVDIVPTFKSNSKEKPSSLLKDSGNDSQDDEYNAMLEATLPDTNVDDFFEKPTYLQTDDSSQVFRRTFNENKPNITERKNDTSVKSAPFLVAIFETLSNVTAQTCAGTLIAPQWVLTAANCINILSNLYANSTNLSDHQSLYTIVAGAVDPLIDGSAHNVTSVLQHHGFVGNSSLNRRSIHVEIGPYLAMMRIEPVFEGAGMALVDHEVKKGAVVIYGWILSKNESGLDTLSLKSISASILSSAECQAMYSYNNNDVICLLSDKAANITQLSSGGPVILEQNGELKMLAVAQTDEHVFIAYPLHVHIDWINRILNNKEL
ncbi:uncharacterized protein LOC142977836 [Anticarsia gemmatalis]|uniref:uncharacterized protein LOC142977836 n=1 Tax=Anticarsia gemmatalis TaxID=129554 RepID=UPI003F760B01